MPRKFSEVREEEEFQNQRVRSRTRHLVQLLSGSTHVSFRWTSVQMGKRVLSKLEMCSDILYCDEAWGNFVALHS